MNINTVVAYVRDGNRFETTEALKADAVIQLQSGKTEVVYQTIVIAKEAI
jgi:hypothetical protein